MGQPIHGHCCDEVDPDAIETEALGDVIVCECPSVIEAEAQQVEAAKWREVLERPTSHRRTHRD
jgi:ssRNA-specific RNase YbeY (16S rRNA maturation enzyme)